MHPLVRDLYKRVLIVGRDYPTGLSHVKQVWKKALRDPSNTPSCFQRHIPTGRSEAASIESEADELANRCQEEILHAVHRGRFMVKEMIGVIQLKKYRTMKKRYGNNPQELTLEEAMKRLEDQHTNPSSSQERQSA